MPSCHRCDSCPSDEVVGSLFFDFEAIRTESSDRDAPRRCVRIPLAALKHRQLMVNTYRLTDTKGRTKKNRGTIDLALRWVHNPEHAVVIDHKYDEKEAFPGREANAIRILLIRARKLPAMDRRLFGKEGTSDPMVTFRLKDKLLESTVKNKQLSPEWLESFELRADDPDDSIVEVIVDDWDQLSGNDCMGKCFIDVKELKNRKLHRRWYALLPPSTSKPNQAAVDDESVSEYSSEGEYRAEFLDHANKAPLGKLELACRWLYLPDFDLPIPDQMLRDTYPHDKINALHIYLVRGTHLPAVDVDVMGHRTSDPLVTFVLEEERKNSKVKKRTLEPFWKEYFDVSVEGDLEPQVLKIQCDDWDLVIVQRRENFKTHDAARRSAATTSWASAPSRSRNCSIGNSTGTGSGSWARTTKTIGAGASSISPLGYIITRNTSSRRLNDY